MWGIGRRDARRSDTIKGRRERRKEEEEEEQKKDT